MYNLQTDILEYKKFKFNNLFSHFSQQEYIKKYVKDNLMFLGVSGSYAYGMESETSDLDVIGIFKDNIDMILGYNKIDQIEFKGIIDGQELNITIYALSKALKLILEQNPNALDLIFLDVHDILYWTKDWNYLYLRRKEMLSTLSRHKFTGYAMSQLKRIKGHDKWLEKERKGIFDNKPEMIDYCRILDIGGRTSREREVLESWCKHSFLTKETNTIFKIWKVFGINKNVISNHNTWFDNKNYTFYFSEKITKHNKKFVGLLFFSKDEFNQALDQYNKWKKWKENRNEKRHILEEKHGYDTKHASHLFRLMLGGLEILREGYYSVKRPIADIEFIKDIRAGKYSYEWVIEKAEHYDKVLMEEAYKRTTLRRATDPKLYVDILKNLLGFNNE